MEYEFNVNGDFHRSVGYYVIDNEFRLSFKDASNFRISIDDIDYIVMRLGDDDVETFRKKDIEIIDPGRESGCLRFRLRGLYLPHKDNVKYLIHLSIPVVPHEVVLDLVFEKVNLYEFAQKPLRSVFDVFGTQYERAMNAYEFQKSVYEKLEPTFTTSISGVKNDT